MESTIYEKTSTEPIEGDKKRLGAFYTPEALTDVICEWAITSSDARVLEPSFGGCGFLKSAAERFRLLGSTNPQLNLYGCDIDSCAFEHLSNTFGDLVDLSHYKRCDFLNFEEKQKWGVEFDSIIGNPPYLPYRHIENSGKNSAAHTLEKLGISLDLRSSLWAYFVALGLNYLKVGGRIAWVLPGSFLQANYSVGLREAIAQRFERVHAFLIHDRLFLYEGTEEQTVVLLGAGFLGGPNRTQVSDISLSICENVDELRQTIAQWDANSLSSNASCGSSVIDFIDSDARSLIERLEALPICRRFGDFIDVRIGLVTGDNRFFVINREIAKHHGLDEECLVPLITKFKFSPGLKFTIEDHEMVADKNGRCLLINADDPHKVQKELGEYLDLFPKDKVETLSTFKKRKVWCRPDDSRPPGAFFPVMHHLGPRLVLNDASINCTNTLHRVYFKDRPKKSHQRLLALSMLSSFSQISAEIVGRRYGSGVLKHEPREAEKILMLMPDDIHWNSVRKIYRDVDRLCRIGDYDKARKIVDEFLLEPVFRTEISNVMRCLDDCLTEIRKKRHYDRS